MAKPKKKPRALDDKQFLAILDAENRTAVGHDADAVAKQQDEALKRYRGQPYGDEVEGRSQFISRDCAQVVDWALPDLLEPFVSGDNIVEFDPTKRELEQPSPILIMQAQKQGLPPPEPRDISQEKADQATDYVNYCFNVDNNGFLVLHDVFKSGYIQKIGIAKIWWEESESSIRETLQHVSAIQLQTLQNDDDVTIVEIEMDEIDADMWQGDEGLQAAYPEMQAFKVTIERKKSDDRLRVVSVPPDEFKISSRSTSVDTGYTCHEVEKTYYELLDMGFDPEQIDNLPNSGGDNEQRELVRFDPEARPDGDRGSPDKTRRKYRLREEHIYADRNGDGQAECVQVFRVGNVILEEREVPENPYAVFCPIPLPHRLIGESLIDKSAHVQRANTVLMRQMLDNLYLSTTPTQDVEEDALLEDGSTLNALLNPVVGQVRIWRSGALANGKVQAGGVQDRSQGAIAGMQVLAAMRERDTGVTHNGASLEDDAIDPKSATQARNEDRNEQSRKRLMARVAAEMFLAPLFGKMLRCICRYQDYERTIKLRGSWISFDPRTWDTSLAPKITVGLGHQNKEEETQSAIGLLNVQKELFPLGLVKPVHIWNTTKRLVKALGYRDASDYFVDVTKEELPQDDKKDPKMVEVEGKLEAKKAELQANIEHKQITSQIDAQAMEQKAALERWRAEQEMAFKAKQQEQETALAMRRQEFEAALAERQQAFERQMAEREFQHRSALAEKQAENAHAVAVKKTEMGGNGVRFGGEIG